MKSYIILTHLFKGTDLTFLISVLMLLGLFAVLTRVKTVI